ncbi:hypothetical protein B0H11DRAFT_2222452 [Mycena galericulata]|nr:hypothetical protein B0H11DRAFT_2222452 [Mycena galericulata]
MPHWTHLLIDEAAQAAEPELYPSSCLERWATCRRPPQMALSFGSIRPSVTPQLVLYPNQFSLLADGASSCPLLQASDIGVMSPFREQVWKLREYLRNAVDVSTVEDLDYQGREMRASPVNPNPVLC